MEKQEIQQILEESLKEIDARNFFLYVLAVLDNGSVKRTFTAVNFHNSLDTEKIVKTAEEIADGLYFGLKGEIEKVFILWEDILTGKCDLLYPKNLNVMESEIEEEKNLFAKTIFSLEKITHTVHDGVFIAFADACIREAFRKAEADKRKYDRNVFAVFATNEKGEPIAPLLLSSRSVVSPMTALKEFHSVVLNYLKNSKKKDGIVYPAVFVSVFVNERDKIAVGNVVKLNREKVSKEEFEKFILTALKLDRLNKLLAEKLKST